MKTPQNEPNQSDLSSYQIQHGGYSIPRSNSRSNSADPTPRQLAPSPYRSEAAPRSISQFYEDAEFVEFLKNIQLFVQAEESPQKSYISDRNGYSCRSYLYSNLQVLRERYKVFKQKKGSVRDFNSNQRDHSRSQERDVRQQLQKSTSMKGMQSAQQSSFRRAAHPNQSSLTPKARLAKKIVNI